jgi:predicted RNase H-like nuclease (RuvC/YqgF family)
LEADGVWRDVGSVEYVNKYVHHVDELIATLAMKRCEEVELKKEIADFDRMLRSMEWANQEIQVQILPDRCRKLQQQLSEETTELRAQLVVQTNELQSLKESLKPKKRGGLFG